MTISNHPRLGIRGRLTALITTLLAVGSAVLVVVLYFLVRRLIASNLNIEGPFFVVTEGGIQTSLPPEIQAAIDARIAEQSALVFQELLWWSLGILAGCILLGGFAAWFLSKRSLGRITAMVETTRRISVTDLQQRLLLPGPDDEIKELGDTIDGMLDRLSDAFERQDRFIAGASHELRTPLTRAFSALEIPLLQGRVPAVLEPDIHEALDATRRCEELIAALLLLARSKRGGGASGVIDLNELVAEVVAEHDEAASARGQRIVARTSNGGPVFAKVARPVALLAVSNLLDNAIKHGALGTKVIVTLSADATTCWVLIENDGPDLTGTDVSQLTEPFHRGERSRLADVGLGLGLALVDSAATSAGGTLELSPRPAPAYGLAARLALSST
ncbi:MAG: ATP-binding protein [Promicromonosporaceae bacterium]|nr:ATP-binding protein [Promicromonosporaceae bacterium]